MYLLTAPINSTMADQIVIMLGTRIESHGDLGELTRREKERKKRIRLIIYRIDLRI